MLTPQEVADHAFSKSAFGGYNMSMVEEYRATEDAMRRALLTAQNMANSMVADAQEKKETLIADAEMEARAKIGALHDEIVAEKKRLNLIKAQTREFVENTRMICESQIRQLDLLPDLTLEQVERTTAEAKKQSDAAADIAALSQKIVASYPEESATGVFTPQKPAPAPASEDAEATIQFPAAKAKAAPARADDDADATRHIRLADLKFGRNYSGEDEED